jgi:hypothetical protein
MLSPIRSRQSGRLGVVVDTGRHGVGGWMSGAIFDATLSYRVAFLNVFAWNLLNMAMGSTNFAPVRAHIVNPRYKSQRPLFARSTKTWFERAGGAESQLSQPP